MILQIFRVHLLRLWHSKSDLVLTFVVPLAFFSVFAIIFGNRSGSRSTPKIRVALSDSAKNPHSIATIKQLVQSATVRIHAMEAGAPSSSVPLFSESQVADLVRRGMIDVGVVFRPYTEDLGDAAMKKSVSSAQTNALALANTNAPRTDFASVQILADTYDQVASQVTAALVQKASGTVLQPASLSSIPSSLQNSMDGQVVTASTNVRTDFSAASIAPKTPPLEIVDVLGGSKTNPAVAMYAAGIAVMFLLFSMTAAGGSLLDEKENGTFERLMTSHLTIDELLMGKWLYMVFLGTLQMTLMFVWGQLVFSVELWRHFDGFIAMTLITVGAASSFALLMASACRSRSQLNWISVIVVLTMSALGGSMVPRYLMSPAIQSAGLWTFNAWALEGYNKVFWRELPIHELTVELGVLTLSGFLFMVVARFLLLRWETN